MARPGEGRQLLTLVTCYPFDAVSPGGPLRYAVTAEAIEDSASTSSDENTGGEFLGSKALGRQAQGERLRKGTLALCSLTPRC